MTAFVVWNQNLAPMLSQAQQASTFSLKCEVSIFTWEFVDGLAS